MDPIKELFKKHKGKVTDKWSHYLSTYDRLFSAYRDKPVQLLEVGVQNGGSLEIWLKYFSQAKKIVGIDINPACSSLQFNDPRVTILVGDANSDVAEKQIALHAQQLDIVIDDGSHRSSDIIKTFARYFPKVSNGGVFVVEDLHCSYWKEFEGGLHEPYSSMSFFKLLADVVNHEHWGIEKKRSELIQGIADQYKAVFNENSLSQIHSVEFMNSVCVIRKLKSSANFLGKRVITGTDASISNQMFKTIDQYLVPQDQSFNEWTTMQRPPGELVKDYAQMLSQREGQIAELNQTVNERKGQIAELNQTVNEREGQIAELNQTVNEREGQIAELNQTVNEHEGQINNLTNTIDEILSSTSWRISAPIRRVGCWIRGTKKLTKLLAIALERSGGWKNTFKKVFYIYRAEGISGMRRRITWVSDHGVPSQNHHTAAIPLDSDDLDGRPILSSVTDQDIDIVVCIHNAMDDVKICLSSIIANTRPPYRLILVDDGSKDDTKRYLETFATTQGATLLRNDKAGGYTRAANQGLRVSSAPWAILLNSDTIVPFGWIEELLKIGESDEKIGIVGPSSNTASWQSAPLLLNENGDWADNPLLQNINVQDMQHLAISVAPPQGIDLPFLNGFALMIRRQLIDDIGVLDEETFGAGYGEENDYCIRARSAGWKLIFAPNAYIFHAQSKSYSTEKRLKLAAAADVKLSAKHDPQSHIWPQVQYCKDNLASLSFRTRLEVMLEDANLGKVPFEGKRVAVFCPIAFAGGGGNILVQESLFMTHLGAQVWLINLDSNRDTFEREYPERPSTLYFKDKKSIKAFIQKNELNFDAVIATAFFTNEWIPDRFDGKVPKLGYYIQDDEPMFFKDKSPEYHAAVKSYEILNAGSQKRTGMRMLSKNAVFPDPKLLVHPLIFLASVPRGVT